MPAVNGISRVTKKRPPKGSKGGAPSYAPTEDQQRLFLGLMVNGVSVAQSARILGMDEKTVRKVFPNEIRDGREMANAKVASRLFDTAISDRGSHAVTACIFWMKARGGWKERDELALTGAEGADLFPETPNAKLAALAGAAAEALRHVGK